MYIQAVEDCCDIVYSNVKICSSGHVVSRSELGVSESKVTPGTVLSDPERIGAYCSG